MAAAGMLSPRAAVSHTNSFSTPASTTLFRRLTWEGTVPLEIRVDPKELPANSDRGLECYYLQAPRVSYLPLLMPDIKKFLMDVVFDENAASSLREEDWWFEADNGALLKWHWPIGLLYDNHTISSSLKPSTQNVVTPLTLILHLASPPTEKLLLSPSEEACKQAFMGQLKEADFMRWGNTKRVTGLRKAEQDGMWEGLKEHNFDDYWKVASKVTPTTSPVRPKHPPANSATSVLSPSLSQSPPPISTEKEKDGAYNVRSVPVRIYLPDGPVLQDLVPPILPDTGVPNTLAQFLSACMPLLFPPPNIVSKTEGAAYALVHGVPTPMETEMAWLGACMVGADGWVNLCIGINR